jgi:hypothetical protein
MLARRFRLRTVLAVCIGTLFSFAIGYDGGCYNIATKSVMSSIVPCQIFDCVNGFLGGAINPCNPLSPVFNGCP